MPRAPRMIVAAALALLPAQARADDLSTEEADLLPRLIDHLCIDLVEDLNGCEQVTLVASAEEPDTADLFIFPDRRRRGEDGPLLVVRSVSFNGAMWGMSPWLEEAPNGSLLLHSEQSGIGRSPWFQTLTIAHREGRFVIAGFSYSSYDRMLGNSMACDVNLLTGAWTSTVSVVTDIENAIEETTDTEGRLPPASPRLADWQAFGRLPAPCTEALDLMWEAERAVRDD